MSILSSPSPLRARTWLTRLLVAGVLLFLAVVAWKILVTTGLFRRDAGASRPTPPVPVRAEALVTGDFPVYVSSLGTVTALNTVLVRSRVDGQLISLHFAEGDTVEADALLARIDPRPFQAQLDQAQGQLARDQAQLLNARQNLARTRILRKQDAATPQDLDNAEGLVRQYEGAVRNDQGLIDAAQLQITFSRITAPIGGRLGLRAVDAGNMIQTTDTNGLVTITQIRPIAMVFTVTDVQLPAVRQAMRGSSLRVEVWDRTRSGLIATGSLASLDNQIDTATGTVKAKAIFANDDDRLFPNQFVNAKLLVDTRRQVCIAPSTAVQIGRQGSFVYVVEGTGKDSRAVLRPVQIGPADDTRIVILQGASAGEQVIVEGLDQLGNNSPVIVAGTQPAGPQQEQP